MGNSRRRLHLTAHFWLVLAAILFIAPFLWMVSTSLKSEARIFPKTGEPPQWIPTKDRVDEQGRRYVKMLSGPHEGRTGLEVMTEKEGKREIRIEGQTITVWPEDFEAEQQVGFQWRNYVKAFQMIDFVNNLRNTLFICVLCVIGTVLSCSTVAYSFARIPWKGRDICFVGVLATMMLPYQVTLIPLFAVYRSLDWVGTFKPLIVPAFFGVPFYIFLLRQFFMTIPQDMSAAARIDGCGEFGIFARIIAPLSKPALATTALFTFLFQWGDFLNPLIFLQDNRQYTLAIALQQFQSQHESAWGPLMAMSTVITIPIIIIFFFTQKTFIQGITMTGLKG